MFYILMDSEDKPFAITTGISRIELDDYIVTFRDCLRKYWNEDYEQYRTEHSEDPPDTYQPEVLAKRLGLPPGYRIEPEEVLIDFLRHKNVQVIDEIAVIDTGA